MTDDIQLLERFATGGDEDAFRELIDRHLDLVYSAALRRVNGDAPLAEDVAQTVFTDLARKARALPRDVVLTGWLYEAARFAATKAVRGERRRQAREQEALTMQHLAPESEPGWEQLGPVLDDAMDELSAPDRNAILLRYFKNQDFQAVGLALGVSDDTAQKRVSRAVERLREFFAKRGVTVGASGLVVVISANAAHAAPAGLATSLATVALATATTGATSPLTLTKGILKLMAWNKLTTASVVGVALLFGAGAIVVTTRDRGRSKIALGAGIPATLVVTNFDRTTPKGTLRYLAAMLDSGNARKVAEAIQLDAGTNPQAEDAVANLVSGQTGFKRVMIAKFGEGNVTEALQRWSLLKVPADGLDEAEERVDGESAIVQLPGRSPLRFVKVAGNWRLALLTGNDKKAIAQFNLAGKLMLDAAGELSTGKYRSAEEVFQVLQSRMMAAR